MELKYYLHFVRKCRSRAQVRFEGDQYMITKLYLHLFGDVIFDSLDVHSFHNVKANTQSSHLFIRHRNLIPKEPCPSVRNLGWQIHDQDDGKDDRTWVTSRCWPVFSSGQSGQICPSGALPIFGVFVWSVNRSGGPQLLVRKRGVASGQGGLEIRRRKTTLRGSEMSRCVGNEETVG